MKRVKKPLKKAFGSAVSTYYLIRSLINKYLLREYLVEKYRKLHLGCGDVKIRQCLNLDCRATSATDIIHDCTNLNLFPEKSFLAVFSNAFLEHLYREKLVPCLKSVHRILRDDGTAIFIGIPDFQEVAKAYLDQAPGIVSRHFDLYNVYRYTHGDPEQSPKWWLGQLHKSLFDRETLKHLLQESGFKFFYIFKYCYKDENMPIPIGFVAFKRKPKNKITKEWIETLLMEYTETVSPKTLEILKL